MRFPLTRLSLGAKVLLLASSLTANAAEPAPPAKEKLQVYLLMGQSNMAGRGKLENSQQTPDPKVLVFNKDDQWTPAMDPLHWDKPKIAGVGLGMTFATTMAEAQPGTTIGLVPCAVGGTPLSRWQKGGDLYTAALGRAKAAAQHGTLAGILWHQGESDSKAPLAGTYQQRFAQMIRDFRADLGMGDLPVVAGELGEFHVKKNGEGSAKVNAALHEAAAELPKAACVPSAGLVDGGDQLHFDANSQREFGRRYAAAMLKLTK